MDIDEKYYIVAKPNSEGIIVWGTDDELKKYLDWRNRKAREPGEWAYADEIEEPQSPQIDGAVNLAEELQDSRYQKPYED